MRELQLWKEEEEVAAAFTDIECLAKSCYYTDCQHESEPRCAVKAAIEAGSLDAGRLENYRKLGREARFLESKGSYEAQRSRKQHWKAIHREQKREYRRREQERLG
jgi:ribosome biogenesis GTPase